MRFLKIKNEDLILDVYASLKSLLMTLSFNSTSLSCLKKKVGNESFTISSETLVSNLLDSVDKKRVLFYEYNKIGDPIECTQKSSNTVCLGIDTGFANGFAQPLYIQYIKRDGVLKEVGFFTGIEIEKNLRLYRMGRIVFDDYEKANRFIKDLEKELLPGEVWKYEKTNFLGYRKTEYEILESYIRTVFEALYDGWNLPASLNYEKIKFSEDKKYALFNTGLLSKNARDVLVLGEVDWMDEKKRFCLLNPILLRDGCTGLINRGFSHSDLDVDMVSFFSDISEIVYDATLKVDTDDIEKLNHCIEDGVKRGRFPEEWEQKFRDGRVREVTDRFIDAIRNSQKIARRNYKYVVPQYRTTLVGNYIQFLMPIYMNSNYEKSPDFALVLSLVKDREGKKQFYRMETILELAWAYNNARVICKPDDSWLNPSKIVGSAVLEEEME
ncbi:DUF3825 domain-containing protein [Candidatus Spyradosoma sp. SGI.093]|uniref:DUF3825 domain-containing protein n=1 Tax=Candidatus Spyradosoma sp. SGI.093 TaxID=3420583 RepID=UPI003D01BF97